MPRYCGGSRRGSRRLIIGGNTRRIIVGGNTRRIIVGGNNRRLRREPYLRDRIARGLKRRRNGRPRGGRAKKALPSRSIQVVLKLAGDGVGVDGWGVDGLPEGGGAGTRISDAASA
jgi:hypothetical protein